MHQANFKLGRVDRALYRQVIRCEIGHLRPRHRPTTVGFFHILFVLLVVRPYQATSRPTLPTPLATQ